MKTFIHHDFGELTRDTKPDGTRTYLTPSGFSYPSVTTITGQATAEGIAKWRARVGNEEANRVSARASSRGTRIHGYCEDYLRGNLFEMDMFDTEMFNSIKFLLYQLLSKNPNSILIRLCQSKEHPQYGHAHDSHQCPHVIEWSNQF